MPYTKKYNGLNFFLKRDRERERENLGGTIDFRTFEFQGII